MKEKKHPKRFLILQVILGRETREEALVKIVETEQLIKTWGGEVVSKEIQHRSKFDSNTYIGSGKLESLKEIVESKEIDVVVLQDVVKSGQLFRIEKGLWEVNHLIQVWDRVGLILNIFEQHASTAEAKLQIELARITHDGPRIYGLGKDRLSRQGGGIGTRGLGETNIERERRLIKDQQRKIKKQLSKLHKQKQQRIQYRKDQGIGPVALVGYTSAGKTSLFNALTGKKKQRHKKLFTTLDTVVGKMKTSDKALPVLVSDTIGFIQDLPPSLVVAFRSTLLESLESELILQVVDLSDPRMPEKIKVVDEILAQLGTVQPQILVFNKTDLATQNQLKLATIEFNTRPHLFVSAETKEGVETLKEIVVQKLTDNNHS